MELTLCQVPEKQLVFTNCVYVHADFKSKLPYVEIKYKDKTSVYMYKCHVSISKNSIALNTKQREWFGIYNTQKNLDTLTILLVSNCDKLKREEADFLEIEVEPTPNTKKSFVLNLNDLTEYFNTNFKNHFLKYDQRLIANVDSMIVDVDDISIDNIVFFKVVNIEVQSGSESESDSSSESDSGSTKSYNSIFYIGPNTNIKFVSKNKKIQFYEKKTLFKGDFDMQKLGIGGLHSEFKLMFRRAFASRTIDKTVADKMGIKHVRGILLHGPPGCGKTLIAKEIGNILNCAEPKVVNGPSLLNKFVGESEKNVRDLFADAIADVKEEELHLIICDEFDALCKTRGTTDSHGDKIVNQFLSYIEGAILIGGKLRSLNNILLICMTNRKDLIDPALLRPGRLELHIKINLPDLEGRAEIFEIHMKQLKLNGFLENNIDINKLAITTPNYSGAEIEGVIKNAASFAISREIEIVDENKIKNKKDADNLKMSCTNPIITNDDILRAISETKSAHGVSNDEISLYTAKKFIFWDKQISIMYSEIMDCIKNLHTDNIFSFALVGSTYCGKTKLACEIALKSKISCITMITPEKMIGLSDVGKCQLINAGFEHVTQTEAGVIILDNFERLIEWTNVGPRFNNPVLQTLMILLNKHILDKSRVVIILTTANKSVFAELEIFDLLDKQYEMPDDVELEGIDNICNELNIDELEKAKIIETKIHVPSTLFRYLKTLGV
jgi:vesicle-fusing ATPase